jgi:hypothetical protein
MRTRERTVLAHWGLSPRYDEPPAAVACSPTGVPRPATGGEP